MVGRGVLIECMESELVTSILIVNRRSIGMNHAKVKEVIHSNFEDYSAIENEFKGYDACFWTLGISALGLKEDEYTNITYDYTIKAAKRLSLLNSSMVFCYVSGAGTDSTEKGKVMWARVKGKTENDLMKLPFKKVYLFRPGYIQPLKGIKSRTKWYNAMYVIFKPLYPLLKFLSPNSVTTSVNIGKSMIRLVEKLPEVSILNAKEINQFSKNS